MPIPMDVRKKPMDVKVHVTTGEGVTVTWSDGHLSRYPFHYLRDVLIRVLTHPESKIDDLLPQRWVERFVDDDSS